MLLARAATYCAHGRRQSCRTGAASFAPLSTSVSSRSLVGLLHCLTGVLGSDKHGPAETQVWSQPTRSPSGAWIPTADHTSCPLLGHYRAHFPSGVPSPPPVYCCWHQPPARAPRAAPPPRSRQPVHRSSKLGGSTSGAAGKGANASAIAAAVSLPGGRAVGSRLVEIFVTSYICGSVSFVGFMDLYSSRACLNLSVSRHVDN